MLAAFEQSVMLGYSRPVVFMRRPYDGLDPVTLEETGLIHP
jgi:hypothetical protein